MVPKVLQTMLDLVSFPSYLLGLMRKDEGKNRAERPFNVTPLQPYDSTSRGYQAEPRKGSDKGRFGLGLSLAMILFLIIFFVFVYEAVMSGYERFK